MGTVRQKPRLFDIDPIPWCNDPTHVFDDPLPIRFDELDLKKNSQQNVRVYVNDYVRASQITMEYRGRKIP